MTQTQQPVVDNEDQLEKIQEYIVPGETIDAVFDLKGMSTGFIGITSKRIIFFDKAYLGKRKAMVSIPYRSMTMVASHDEGVLLTRGFLGSSTLVIHVADMPYEFEFRGADKAHMAYQLIMSRI